MKHALLTAREIHGPYTQLLTNLQGENGNMWLEALKRFNRKENPWLTIVTIDRSLQFDPSVISNFMLMGSINGWVKEQEEKEALKIRKLDVSEIQLRGVADAEEQATGVGRIHTLSQKHILLDVQILHFFLQNKELIPDSWRPKYNEEKHVFFDGTIVRWLWMGKVDGRPRSLCLSWDRQLETWGVDHFPIEETSPPNSFSAVLER